jgi:transcriptional regulator with XRE-family HTH domain
MARNLIEEARIGAGLTQQEMADRGGTSRTTLSAYEHGRKSPNLDTAERLLAVAGYELTLQHRIKFSEVKMPRGRRIHVPNRLWQLNPVDAFRTVQLPLSVNWSNPGKEFDLSVRRQRARLYEIVIREGMPKDILKFIDGSLLIDSWQEIVLPQTIRTHWEVAIDAAF